MPYFLLQLILLRWWGMQVTNALAPQHVPFTWTHFVKVTTMYNNYKKLMLTKETTRQSFLKDPTMTLETCKPVFFFLDVLTFFSSPWCKHLTRTRYLPPSEQISEVNSQNRTQVCVHLRLRDLIFSFNREFQQNKTRFLPRFLQLKCTTKIPNGS